MSFKYCTRRDDDRESHSHLLVVLRVRVYLSTLLGTPVSKRETTDIVYNYCSRTTAVVP